MKRLCPTSYVIKDCMLIGEVVEFWRFDDLTIWRLDDLDVWKRGIDFVEEVSGFTQIAQMTQI